MNSRMNKYYNENEFTNSRYTKNAELYKEISKNELDNYSIKSNATVIGDNNKEIDVEHIKRILDTKYNNTPKRMSIRLEESIEETPIQEDTKEYDINVILEKAKEKKQDNYAEERLKRLRDTQYDILKNLKIDDKERIEEDEEEEDSLKMLINTIALNETKAENSALDILSDLKGDDNTEVLKGLKEEIEKKEEKKSLDDTQMINSFYTESNALNNKDFEDIEEFQKSIESNNSFIKIIIAIIAIVFLIGIGLIIKTLYF